jgi:hypothetical protein
MLTEPPQQGKRRKPWHIDIEDEGMRFAYPQGLRQGIRRGAGIDDTEIVGG